MPEPFTFISQYFWVLCLLFGALNYLRTRMGLSAQARIEAAAYLRNFALGMNLPWLVMGAGQLTGYTPTVWYYFRPQDGNPFVIAWLATIFLASYIYAWWVFFAGGAEKIRHFNLLLMLGQRQQPVWAIKLFAAIGVLMFPFWVCMTVSLNAPLPKF